MNAADGHPDLPGETRDDDIAADFAAARHIPRAASPPFSAWTHCLPSAPVPASHADPDWQQYLLAGIAAR